MCHSSCLFIHILLFSHHYGERLVTDTRLFFDYYSSRKASSAVERTMTEKIKGHRKARLHITGMSCSTCAATIEKALVETAGVVEAKVNMEIRTVEGFSGHSDRAQLLNFVRRASPKPQRVICVHGDENKCTELASALYKLFKVETKAPRNLETIRLH